jgi:hypothetical protein
MLINEQERTGLSPLLERAATIRLEEEMFSQARQRGLDLTGYLEELDPSRPESALDAFERQLALAGIRVSGSGSDIIDRFFSTKETSVLFPEYVSRSVRAGMQDFRKLDRIVASRTRIDSDTYKTVYMDDSVLDEEDLQLARAGEGAALPKIELKTAEHSIQIYKFGRYLETSYEAIRRRKAAVVSIFLKAIGVQLQKDKFAAAIDVIVSGDGNSNAATVQSTAGATLAYSDLVTFSLAFDPYELNVMIANKSTAAAILNLTEFKDPGVAVNFQLKGEIPTPFGAQLLVDESVPADKIIGIDNRFALEEVYETSVLTESEKLIRQQLEGTAISEVAGFGKILNSATRVLNITG